MNVQGTCTLSAPPARVFEALINPSVLQRVIPGCEKMEKTGTDEYNAHLKLGIASVKGSYVGKVKLTDQQPPHKFTLHMEGKGAPGFVKGSSVIELKEEGGGTKLSYTANVQVGGLIAAVGSRVVEAAAKKLAGEFFQKFAETIKHPSPGS
ncbi:MAG: carbon monoxide dehydrogenase subunit G [Verrucomicrobia bacterium]|nr:carbon monoxide dehydrogenase subunit G [Verrucomicrobiota bacterium]